MREQNGRREKGIEGAEEKKGRGIEGADGKEERSRKQNERRENK